MPTEKVTPDQIRARKGGGPAITLLPAYDATFGRLLDAAGIDIILVGDSLGQFVQGHPNTLPVTVDDLVYHLKCVRASVERGLLAGDMPFLSFQISKEEALRNAGRMIKEGGAEAIKMEGGLEVAETIEAMTRAGIPVISHIGVQPQSVLLSGQFRASRGRALEDIRKIFRDGKALVEAGAFAVVVEAVPRELGKKLTQILPIPTLGIGAGPDCDGQVLVTHDLLGLFTEFKPKFAKRYADLSGTIVESLKNFARDVEGKTFPNDEHSYHLTDDEIRAALDDFE